MLHIFGTGQSGQSGYLGTGLAGTRLVGPGREPGHTHLRPVVQYDPAPAVESSGRVVLVLPDRGASRTGLTLYGQVQEPDKVTSRCPRGDRLFFEGLEGPVVLAEVSLPRSVSCRRATGRADVHCIESLPELVRDVARPPEVLIWAAGSATGVDLVLAKGPSPVVLPDDFEERWLPTREVRAGMESEGRVSGILRRVWIAACTGSPDMPNLPLLVPTIDLEPWEVRAALGTILYYARGVEDGLTPEEREAAREAALHYWDLRELDRRARLEWVVSMLASWTRWVPEVCLDVA